MTKTMWTSAPAGVSGEWGADVRPYPGVVVCPTPDALQGTGLPVARFATDVRGTTGDDVARLRSRNGSAIAVLVRTDEPALQRFIDQTFPQHDGTTLGIHTPGRPQS